MRALLARVRQRLRWRRHATLAPAIYRWDLDKTYLRSDFESLRKMVRVPFERAEDKVDEPGVVALIRALKRRALEQERAAYVYFISASPPQIGRAIRQKLDLDGIDADGIVFKDQLHHLVRGRFRYLREQIGYKLVELLKARLDAPAHAVEFLFGDDWESDPLIYSLYADVVSGALDRELLAEILVRLRIDPARLVEIKALASRVAPEDVVHRIYINLERRTPPGRFAPFGPRLVPTFNYFQTALVLHRDGVLAWTDVHGVGRSLLDRSGYTPIHLRNSVDDLRRRGVLPARSAAAMRRRAAETGLLPTADVGSVAERWWGRVRPQPGSKAERPAEGIRIDYERLIDTWEASGGRPREETA